MAPCSSKPLERFRQCLLQNLCHLTELRTCFTHSLRIFNNRAIVVAGKNAVLGSALNPGRTINEVKTMSKDNVYSGTASFSKRSRTGRSKNVQSHSPKPSNSRSSPDSTSMFEPLFDSVEAARLVRIHPKTVVRMARRGQINGVRFGKLWRFRLSDLQQYVDTHSRTTDVA
jgi:excisionase family DNA binding protein